MLNEIFSLDISSAIGKVSAIFSVPEDAVSIMTLAHGAGAGMQHAFMQSLAEALAETKVATMRFNFPFTENKKGRPDLPAVAHKTIEAAMHQANQQYPALPLFLAGKSFGGRMSSQYLALQNNTTVKGLVFFGFPLHPPKKPATDRAEHLKQVQQPKLFLQGTRDALAEWTLIESVCASLPHATLVKIEGADHAFKKGKEDLVPGLARQAREWMDKVMRDELRYGL